MVKAPELEKKFIEHKLWTCFICEKESCMICQKLTNPLYSRFTRLCTEHRPGECTHPKNSSKLFFTTVYCCKYGDCKRRLHNFIQRPAACVKQSYRTQVEKLVNNIRCVRKGSKKAMTKREHSYGKLIEIFSNENGN